MISSPRFGFPETVAKRNSGDDLIAAPTPGHLTVLFLPALLVAAAILVTAAAPRRSLPGIPIAH